MRVRIKYVIKAYEAGEMTLKEVNAKLFRLNFALHK